MPQAEERPYEISPSQTRALESLVSGATITESAKHGGVDRSTLHRWLRDDSGFQAAVNEARLELQQATQVRLAQIAAEATDVVGKAVQDGNVRAALAVLKGLGLLCGERPPIGPRSADLIEQEARLESGQRRESMMLGSLCLGLD